MTSTSLQTSSQTYIQTGLLAQEEKLEMGKLKKILTIGIPCETKSHENRIPLTPLGVMQLVKSGHHVIVETKVGSGAKFSDLDYSEAGAIIVQNKADVFKCDIIVKIAPLTLEEVDYLRQDQAVFSFLCMPTLSEELMRSLLLKKTTAISLELLTDNENVRPVVRAMNEISGSVSIMIAAEYLSTVHGGKGVLLGGFTGITPVEIVIIGAGTASEFAARTALGLGATVKVFDQSIHKLRALKHSLGQNIFTSIIQPQVLAKTLQSADVVIGATEQFDDRLTYFVSEDMVRKMKHGSVIIDLDIEQGSVFETSKPTSHSLPVFSKFGVIHYCVTNVPSRVARTASIALSDILVPIFDKIGQIGGIRQQLGVDPGLRKGAYVFKGILTNNIIGNRLGIPSNDIDLLMPMFE